MCRLCDSDKPQLPCPTRRDFLKTGALAGAATTAAMFMSGSAQVETVLAFANASFIAAIVMQHRLLADIR